MAVSLVMAVWHTTPQQSRISRFLNCDFCRGHVNSVHLGKSAEHVAGINEKRSCYFFFFAENVMKEAIFETSCWENNIKIDVSETGCTAVGNNRLSINSLKSPCNMELVQ